MCVRGVLLLVVFVVGGDGGRGWVGGGLGVAYHFGQANIASEDEAPAILNFGDNAVLRLL